MGTPQGVLVTDSDGRKGQFVLVGDGQVDLGRLGQEILELGDDQEEKSRGGSEGHYHPSQPKT